MGNYRKYLTSLACSSWLITQPYQTVIIETWKDGSGNPGMGRGIYKYIGL